MYLAESRETASSALLPIVDVFAAPATSGVGITVTIVGRSVRESAMTSLELDTLGAIVVDKLGPD